MINIRGLTPYCQYIWRKNSQNHAQQVKWCRSCARLYNVGMGKKGIRPQKGQPETDWGEAKTAKLNIGLTPTGKKLVRERANQLGISVSEVLERWARGIPVDINNPPAVEPINPMPTVESILKALSRYSRYQIGRIVRAGLDLLIGAPPTTEQQRIGDLVRENQEAVLEMFDEAIENPEERIQQIINGNKPTQIELSLLSAALPIDDDELMQIFKKEFPNGSNQGCTTNH